VGDYGRNNEVPQSYAQMVVDYGHPSGGDSRHHVGYSILE
jgi:hypothetical protein